MTSPKISVIVPVYKAEKYISQCIDSILQQSFTDFELLLIDDGSPDNSGKICDNYAIKDSRIRVFHQENKGVSIARNLGLENANGEWITFVDSDDYILPGSLKTLYGYSLKENTEIIIANSYTDINNKLIKKTFFNYSINESLKLKVVHNALWGYLIRNSIIKKTKARFIEGLAYSEDCIFIHDIFYESRQILYIKDYIYVYRTNINSACQSLNYERTAKNQFEASIILMQHANKYKNNIFIYNSFLSWSKKFNTMGIYALIKGKYSLKNIYNLYALNKSRNNIIWFTKTCIRLYIRYIRRVYLEKIKFIQN